MHTDPSTILLNIMGEHLSNGRRAANSRSRTLEPRHVQQKPLRIKCYAGTLKRGLSSTVTAALGSGWRSALTRVTHQGGGMISVSDCQLRIVAATADLLPVEARGTFLQRVTAELRGRRDFSDCDVEQTVRGALLDQSAARSPLGQGCGDAPRRV